MIAVEAALAGLAGWRLASLLVQEDGPFAVFERLRLLVGVDNNAGVSKGNVIAGALSCVWCTSVWTSGAMFALAHWGSTWPVAGVAAMSIAVGWHEYVMRE